MASNIKLINLASYTSPKISENPRLSWVEYGDDNNYFEYLIDLYNASPTNNAVITGIIDMIYGKGVNATNAADNAAGFMELRRLISPEQLKRVVNDFYMLGNAAFQVVYTADKSKIAEVYHMPVETLRAEKCNEEGEIAAYYYAYDWSKVRNKSQAERIPAFGYGAAGEKIEILYIRPYRSGSYYYSPVDYTGCLPYCELEQQISNYHINNIKNGLAPSMIINFNNGIPPQEEQDNIDFAIRQKWSGTNNAGKYILAFNDDSQKAATIEPVTLSEAHLQYEFLSRESSQKIMVAHRVSSPMLFGIKDNTGLGNNAEEIKNAFQLMDNVVVRPKQEEILKGIDKLLAYNKVNLDLYFETLTPIEFTDIDVVDAATVQEETGVDVAEAVTPQAQEELIQKEASYNGAQIASSLDIMRAVNEGVLTQDQAITFLVQMLQFDPEVARALFAGNSSSVITQMKSQKGGGDSRPFLKEELAAEIVAKLQEIGESEEDLLKDFELVDAELVDDEEAEYDVESYLNSRIELAAQDKSEQDTERYKVRYFYTIGTRRSPNGTSRVLCSTLMNAARVYRKEDIEALSSNGGAEAQGKPYSVWLYKGGANCYHRWERRVYRKKLTKDGKVWGGGTLNGTDIINVNEAVRQGFKLPKNAKEVAIAPIESDYSGYTAEYAREHGIPK